LSLDHEIQAGENAIALVWKHAIEARSKD
jgi:hypothetical protein